jgi:polyprenyl-phospho-N-acetylgalactosaminyl synthase
MENIMPTKGGSAFSGKVFCVIPAYNEAKNIEKIVAEVKPLVNRVVVVDDGSSDNTFSLANIGGIDLLRHIINRGQGAALRTGTDYSLAKGADIVVHFDADGQFLSQDIARVIKPIEIGTSQVVYGSRFLDQEANISMPILKRYLIMPLAKAVNKIFFKIDLTDPQSGFRALSKEALNKIRWQQDGMAHCSEIMLLVKKNNLKVTEVPIQVIYRRFGQNFFSGIKILKDLFIALLINQ